MADLKTVMKDCQNEMDRIDKHLDEMIEELKEMVYKDADGRTD